MYCKLLISVSTLHRIGVHLNKASGMGFWHFLGWFILNVAVPLLLPIALLPWLGFSKKYQGRGRELIRESLAEGQLFWSIIAMCAAAIYEASIHVVDLIEAGKRGSETVPGWLAIGWHFAIIVVSAVLVLIRTMEVDDEKAGLAQEQPPPDRPVSVNRIGAKHASKPKPEQKSGIVTVSIQFAVLTAASFTATHLWAI